MPIDTSIYNLLQPVRSPLLDVGKLFEQGQRLRGGQLDLREQERLLAAQEAERQAYAQHYGGGTPAGLAGAAPTGPPAGLAGAAPPEGAPGPARYGPALTGMLEQYQAEGAPVETQPPPASGGGAGLTGLAGQMGGAGPMTPGDLQGQRGFINRLYTISPKAGREAENHAYTTQKSQLEQQIARVDYLGRVADGVLESANPQQAWEVARAMLIEQGMPPSQVPEVVDLNYVRQLSGMGHDAGDKLRLAQARLADAQAQRERGKAPDYGLGEGLNTTVYEMFGAQIPPGGRPTPTQVQQARAEYYRTDPEQRYRTQRARREEYEADATRGVREEMTGSGRRMSEQEMTGRPRRMSAADVADAMAQTGRSRAEVVAAARENGLTVEDAPDTGTAPSAAAAAPSAAAAAPSAAPSTAPSAVPSTAPSAVPSTAPSAVPSTAPRAAQAAPAGVRRSPAATATAPGEGATTGTAPGEGATTAPASPSGDMTRLRRLEALRDTQEEQVARVKRKWGTSEAGRTAVSQAEQELTRRNTEIDRLRTRLEGPEQEARKTTAREEAQRQQLRGQTTAETLKEHAPQLYDVTTATPINPSTPYGDVLEQQRAGTVKQLSKRQAERLEVAREAVPVLAQMVEYTERIFGAGGELESANPASLDLLIKGTLTPRQMQEEFPLLTEAARFVDANAGSLARGLKGETGAMSEGDVDRSLAGLPNFRSVFKLGLGLGGAFSTRGVGPAFTVKPEFKPADTARVARGVLESTIDTLNSTTGAILGQPGFRYPELAWPEPVQGPPAPSPTQRQGPGTGTRRLPSTYDLWRGQQP